MWGGGLWGVVPDWAETHETHFGFVEKTRRSAL